MEEKTKLLHLLEEGQFCTAVARYFGVFRHTISRIKKSKEEIMKMSSSHDATFKDFSNANKNINI